MTRNNPLLQEAAKVAQTFTTACRRCDRLARLRDDVHDRYPEYFAKAVPSFGPDNAHLLVVGLAPGMHGANATGRPFTGDFAGILLYETLFDFGFSNRPVSTSAADDLELIDCRITNAVRCLPPQNKPSTEEIRACNVYLGEELESLPRPALVVALGTIAHRAVLTALGKKPSHFRFAHGYKHALDESLSMLDSYHCSRYNTQTRRLTSEMFQDIFRSARDHLKDPNDR